MQRQEAGPRRYIHDGAAAGRSQMRVAGAHHQDRAGKIDTDHTVPVLDRHGLDVTDEIDAGGIDDPIDTAEMLPACLGSLRHRLRIRDVGSDGEQGMTVSVPCKSGEGRTITIERADARTLGQKAFDSGGANYDVNGNGSPPANDFIRVDGNGNFIRFKKGDKITGIPLGINPGRGVPYFQVDMRVTKRVNIGERIKIEGYVEFFNLLNRANIGNTFQDSIFSQIATGKNTPPRDSLNVKDLQPTGLLGSSFGAGTTIGIPFNAQFGVRVSF